MMTVSIIGVGRVGGALALSLPKAAYTIEHLIYRSNPAAGLSDESSLRRELWATVDELSEVRSDIILISTQDGEIDAAAHNLVPKVSGSPIVFHTSGALSSAVLNELRSVGCSLGSIHPLVSISAPEFGPERFRGAFFCIEGDSRAVEVATRLVNDLGGRPFTVASSHKTLYHCAAVTACGHLVALFDAAIEMMTKCGLSTDEAKSILLPLVTSTVQNLGAQSTAAALTGTFARADVETFSRHLTSLNEYASDDLLEIYLLLAERSLELAARQGVDPDKIKTLRGRVSVAKSMLKW